MDTPYALVVALHVTADLLFVAGLLALALLLAALSFQPAQGLAKEQRLIGAVARWNRVVTGPALGVAWACGLWLAWTAGWFGAGWLTGKLVLVVVLSALHGKLSAALRRAAAQPPEPPARAWRAAPPATVLAVAAIVWLVLMKPH